MQKHLKNTHTKQHKRKKWKKCYPPYPAHLSNDSFQAVSLEQTIYVIEIILFAS